MPATRSASGDRAHSLLGAPALPNADPHRHGRLTVIFPGGREYHFGGYSAGPSATIEFKRARVIKRLMAGGGLGFARSYMDGDWATPDLGHLLDLAIANEADWERLEKPMALFAPLHICAIGCGTIPGKGARRNIAFHYDLGNDFYRAWLDPSMTYSSAIFRSPDVSLEAAQAEKYGRIIRDLGITAEDHVLEIGCGWGVSLSRPFARRAAG